MENYWVTQGYNGLRVTNIPYAKEIFRMANYRRYPTGVLIGVRTVFWTVFRTGCVRPVTAWTMRRI